MRELSTGAGALEAVASWRPDIVLLDIGMPGMDSYEVVRRMRQLPHMTRARILALNGYGDEEARERVRAAGFDGHPVKPVGAGDLEAVIAQVDKVGQNR